MRRTARLTETFLIGLSVLGLGTTVTGQEPTQAVPNALKSQDRLGVPVWKARHEKFLERSNAGDVGLLFVGDSITQGWEGVPAIWDRFYGSRKAANYGIGGDQTGHVLWRLEHDELKNIAPKAVVLMIGTNNLGADRDEDIARGIAAVVTDLRKALPEAKILLLGVFPRSEKQDHFRERIKAINDHIRILDDGKTVRYLDIGPVFLEADGTISKQIMPDFLHLSGAGYQRWAEAIEPTLWTLLNEK